MKPSVFMVLPKKWFPFLPPLFEERFEVEYWPNYVITKEELMEKVKGKFGICIVSRTPVDEDVIKAAGDSLKVVNIYSAGYENVDVKALKAHGIKIGHLGSNNTEATAEMALALLLSVGRRLKEYINLSGQRIYGEIPRDRLAFSLQNSTVGIIGCGSIGTSIARKLKAFELKHLMYFARTEKPEVKAMGGEFCSLHNIMRESDFVVVALSLNKYTEKIISKTLIDLMKPTAIFVNVGRGALVDQDALTEALQLKKIAGAGLDVTIPHPLPSQHPLFQMDNVVISPHVASNTVESVRQADELTAKNFLAVLNGEKMPMELNLTY